MLLTFIFGLLIGIWAGSFVLPSWGLVLACFVLSGLSYLSGFKIEDKKKIAVVAIFFLGLGLGFTRMHWSDEYRSSVLSHFAEQHISATGIIVDEPDVREHNTKLTVKLTEVTGISGKLSEKVLITVPLYPEYHYGDKISAELLLDAPKPIDSDGRTFDYEHYLRVRGIWYVGRYARVHLLSPQHGSIVKTLLFKTKHLFTESVNKVISEPESSLLSGLLLGTKQSLGTDLLEEFNRAGVSHMVVLSGYNIAIVAESIMAFLVFLPASLSFSVGAFSILLFTVMAGGGASATRAAIMVLVALFAKHTNRTYSAARAFVIAVVVMLLWNPLLLSFDPSFQLSALATVGIIFVSPLVIPYLLWVPEKYGLREIISSTVATQIVVLPFLIYNTGVLSFVSLPVNILVLGTVPLTMLLGFVTGTLGLISTYVSFIPALPTYLLLWYQLSIVHLGATLPFGAVTLPAFSVILLLFVYALISIFLFLLQKRKS